MLINCVSVHMHVPTFRELHILYLDMSFSHMIFLPASVAQLDARPTGHQEVAGSIPAEVGNILS